MSTVSPELLAGFVAEARGYLVSLRKALADGAPDNDALQEMHRQAHILAGSSEMLSLTRIAALARPAEEMLESILEKEGKLTAKHREQIAKAIDGIETELAALDRTGSKLPGDALPSKDGSSQIPPVSSAKPAKRISPLPELPPGLLEVFLDEAHDHCEVIQNTLENVRRDPADKTALSEMRRVTHTLKGAAASVGMDRMARLAHLMEELMERTVERGEPLAQEGIEVLFDSVDVLEQWVEPGREEGLDVGALVESIDERFVSLLGEAYPKPETPSQPGPLPEESEGFRGQQRAENTLRLPLEDVDALINRVGEIIINQAAFEGHLGTLRDLTTELGHAARRMRRVADDIGTHIEATSPVGVEGRPYDSTFDPLELEHYSLLYQYTLELSEIATDTGDLNSKLHILSDDLDGAQTRERRLTTELQDGLMTTRLVSFRELETRMRRTVRRTARDVGKEVEIILTGFDAEVDKTILDTLADPLMHLLRNAVDHGIEEPDARKKAGKPAEGLITLGVVRERSRVVLRLSDDGAGIDQEQIRRRGVALGLLREADRPGTDELMGLLFEEGFTLSERVTQTSGRGVGLNIVRRAVTQLQGTVRIETSAGHGTTFIISVPITLAITRALFIRSCGETFAVPMEQIASVVRMDEAACEEIRKQDALHHEGEPLPVFNLATFVVGEESDLDAQRYGVVIETPNRKTVVLVEGLAGAGEAVVKSLGSHLRRVHGVYGATIAGDGSVVLILDLAELVGGEAPDYRAHTPTPTATVSSVEAVRHVLVVDDSPSVRRVVCSFLERAGWRATAARDGIEALEYVESDKPDVALVDIEMPRMNGFELLSHMKADPALKDVPVIFLTSRSATKHRDRAIQLQVDGYLVKPYREDELLQALTRVTQKVRQP